MCRTTNAKQVLSFLKHHGVRLGTEDPGMVDLFTNIGGGLLIKDYESGFMSEKEREAFGGNFNLASTGTSGGEADSVSFAKNFLDHPYLGHRRRTSSI